MEVGFFAWVSDGLADACLAVGFLATGFGAAAGLGFSAAGFSAVGFSSGFERASGWGVGGVFAGGERGALLLFLGAGVFRGCALGLLAGGVDVGTTFQASVLEGAPPKEIGAFFGP